MCCASKRELRVFLLYKEKKRVTQRKNSIIIPFFYFFPLFFLFLFPSFINFNMSLSHKQANTLPSPPIHQQFEYTMTRDQQKYCGAIIRNLKRHRDAAPFLKPVDYVKLNVPDYPNIVKQPMDLTLVDSKLSNLEYMNVEEFVSDIRLIFNNCFKYNGPEAMISVLCQNVESAFEKSLRQMPISNTKQEQVVINKELSPPLSQHNSPPPSLLSEDLGRPKREIHCPSKDYPETFTTQRKLSLANKTSEMKFCFSVLKEFKKNKYRHQMYAFLQPVDPIALNIPDYFTIIKNPMDLSTIENKLLNDEYKSSGEFKTDVLLMFNNCYLYNPPTLPIYSMAKEMEKIFLDKWEQKPKEDIKKARKPSLKKPTIKEVESEEDEEEEESEDEEKDKDDKIAQLERSLKSIKQQVESMKKTTPKKTVIKKAPTPPVKRKRLPKKKAVRPAKYSSSSEDEAEEETAPKQRMTYTFEQKMKLSNRINGLNPDELNGVVEIIQNSINIKGVSKQL